MNLQQQFDTAFDHLQQGRADDAIRLYMEILKADESQPDALYMLGALGFKMGQMDAALHFSEKLTQSAPTYARGWVLKALVMRAQRQMENALTAAQKALTLDDTLEEAWECAAMVLMHEGRWDAARDHIKKALAKVPDNKTLQGYYALALAESGDLQRAWRESGLALGADTNNGPALMAKLTTLSKAGYYDLALKTCRDASGDEKLHRAMAFGQAEAALITGSFDEGYALLAADEPAHSPTEDVPDWNGEYDSDHNLILYGDQGYGDMLQLIRYASDVAQKVPHLTVRVPATLERLYRSSMPDLDLSVYAPRTNNSRRTMDAVDPVFEFPENITARCSYMTLPHALNIGATTGAGKIPYLRADPVMVTQWRERLADMPGPRIGIVWSGNPTHTNDHNRSIAFERLKPFIEKFRAHIVSLQTGPQSEHAKQAGIFDAAPFIRDFADSAACIEELDVLISVDTAPVHLAGGMGRAVWVLLPFDPDWRWLVAREDSPWYPSARLFRQPQPGDWDGVLDNLTRETARLVGGDRESLRPKAWAGDYPVRQPQPVPLEGIDEIRTANP